LRRFIVAGVYDEPIKTKAALMDLINAAEEVLSILLGD
jgi:hypothetical protein